MACPVTVYRPTASNDARRIVFYLHGGGLVYGERDDLPSPYVRAITDAGSTLVCADYPLAPETALPDIVDALYETWRTEVAGPIERGECIDYLLFGRSAGAYLALLLAREIRLRDQDLPQPAGIMWLLQPGRALGLRARKRLSGFTGGLPRRGRAHRRARWSSNLGAKGAPVRTVRLCAPA